MEAHLHGKPSNMFELSESSVIVFLTDVCTGERIDFQDSY